MRSRSWPGPGRIEPVDASGDPVPSGMDAGFCELLRERRTVREMRRTCSSFLELLRPRPSAEIAAYARLFRAAVASGTVPQMSALMHWRAQAEAVERLRKGQSAMLTRAARELARVRGLRRRIPESERDGLPCPDCGNVQPALASRHLPNRKLELRVNGLVDVHDYCRALIFLWGLRGPGR